VKAARVGEVGNIHEYSEMCIRSGSHIRHFSSLTNQAMNKISNSLSNTNLLPGWLL
jgi:hypothetical protein